MKACPTHDKNCAASEHFQCKKNGKALCKNCVGCTYAAKEVKPCPKGGAARCRAKVYVKMADGSEECAKADLKALGTGQGNAPAPVRMTRFSC